MTHSPPSYFCSIPATDIWYPVAPGVTTLPAAPTPTVNASPVPVNAAELPEDWDPSAPDLCYLFQDILSASAPAVFPLVVTPGSILPPYSETVTVLAITRTVLAVNTVPYALVLPPVVKDLRTQTRMINGDDSGTAGLVASIAAPVLGAPQVVTADAESAGWTLIYNLSEDVDIAEFDPFLFSFYIDAVSFDNCVVNSDSFITFGDWTYADTGWSEAVPEMTKLHVGSADLSMQRVYEKSEANVCRIRWEGNSDRDYPEESNRFWEVAFYKPLDDGTTYIELRTGDLAGATDGLLMLANATTALATGTFAANSSWVFEGNSDGTTWTLHDESHIELS